MNDQDKAIDGTSPGAKLTAAERKALIEAEKARVDQEEALDDVRAEQQMLEGAVDTDMSVRRMERERSRDQDEPDDQLDLQDPVSPKGI